MLDALVALVRDLLVAGGLAIVLFCVVLVLVNLIYFIGATANAIINPNYLTDKHTHTQHKPNTPR